MKPLARALIRFACEATIYASQSILEALDAQRPMLDDPLPDDPWQQAQYHLADYLEQHRDDIRRLAEQTDTPTLVWPGPGERR